MISMPIDLWTLSKQHKLYGTKQWNTFFTPYPKLANFSEHVFMRTNIYINMSKNTSDNVFTHHIHNNSGFKGSYFKVMVNNHTSLRGACGIY